MTTWWRVLVFIAQSSAFGLAVAFFIVLLRPDLVNLGGSAQSPATSYASAVNASAPAVVSLRTARLGQRGSLGATRLGQQESLGAGIVVDQGLGSGVIISGDGLVVTNWHVIRDADQVVVQLADGREAHPRFVGADPETELALLKVDLPDLPAIRLGRSDTLEIGDVVLAIGNAYGLSQSVTSGIVSATGRGIGLTIFENLIQTDAAINIGNSGGALVNTRGELIGINTARFATLNRSPPEGIGFAIPVNLVRGVMDELLEHGRVIRGWLGVDAWDLPGMNAAALGISGPAVELAEVGGPAAAAGLIAGDIITHINDERMLSRDQAMNRVAGLRPGDTIHIRGHRPGAGAFETVAVLEERPAAGR